MKIDKKDYKGILWRKNGDELLTIPGGSGVKNTKHMSQMLKQLLQTKFISAQPIKIQLHLVQNDSVLKQRLLEFEHLDPMVLVIYNPF
jgi:hypothetical protein